MKLLTFIQNDQFRLGVKIEQGVFDVLAALSASPSEASVPTTVHEVIDGGAVAVESLRHYMNLALAQSGNEKPYLLEESTLTMGPCVTHPNKMICVGLNYRKHAEETNAAIPEYPI